MLHLAFKVADDNGLLLLDFKDLRALLQHVGENAQESHDRLRQCLGAPVDRRHPARAADAGAAGRRPVLRRAGARSRRLHADRRATAGHRQHPGRRQADADAPKLYATFLLWLLSELFERCPKSAIREKPSWCSSSTRRICCSTTRRKPLLDKIEQVVRLIRSKGVGVFFITQNPIDIPDTVLGQLGNRVQHALRAFTPRDQKAVKAAAETFRAEPEARRGDRDHRARRGRGAGLLPRRQGRARAVERGLIAPPRGRIGPSRCRTCRGDEGKPARRQYDSSVDRESAYEVLTGRATGGQVTHDEAPAANPSRRSQYDAPTADASSSPGPWAVRGSRSPNPPSRQSRGPGWVRRNPRRRRPSPGRRRGAAFDRHDDHQDRGAYGDQRGCARGVEGHIRQRPKSGVLGSIVRGVLGSLVK